MAVYLDDKLFLFAIKVDDKGANGALAAKFPIIELPIP